MSSPAVVRAAYDLHGIAIAVESADAAVLDAVELRLRGFGPVETASSDAASLRFEVDEPWPEAAAATTRPVYDTPHGTLSYSPVDDVLLGRFGPVAMRCAPGQGLASFWSEAFTGAALYLATHPLTTVSLMELLKRRGRFSLHAGCLASAAGDGVLLAGPSGAGKSTLTLALARTGLSFLSDDVVFLNRAGTGRVRALGFPDAVGIGHHAARCFPDLRVLAASEPEAGFPKALRRIEDIVDVPVAMSCEPRVLVFPTVAPDRPSAVAALDPGEALVRLVPDVLVTDPVCTQAHLDTIGALLDQVRCYEVRSGSDLARAARLIRGLI